MINRTNLKKVLKYNKEKTLGSYLSLEKYIDSTLNVTQKSVVGQLCGERGRRNGVSITADGNQLSMIPGVYRIRIDWEGHDYFYIGESSGQVEKILHRVMSCIHALRYLPHNTEFRDLLSESLNMKLSHEEANQIFASKKFKSTLELGDFFIRRTKEAKKARYRLARKLASSLGDHKKQKSFFSDRVYLAYIPISSAHNVLVRAATKYLESLALLKHRDIVGTEMFLNERDEVIHIETREKKFKEVYRSLELNVDDACELIHKLYEYS